MVGKISGVVLWLLVSVIPRCTRRERVHEREAHGCHVRDRRELRRCSRADEEVWPVHFVMMVARRNF